MTLYFNFLNKSVKDYIMCLTLLTTESLVVWLKPGLFQTKTRLMVLKQGLTSAAQRWLFATHGLQTIMASAAQRFSRLMVLKQAWLQTHNAARRS